MNCLAVTWATSYQTNRFAATGGCEVFANCAGYDCSEIRRPWTAARSWGWWRGAIPTGARIAERSAAVPERPVAAASPQRKRRNEFKTSGPADMLRLGLRP